jgi:hypothetical protein
MSHSTVRLGNGSSVFTETPLRGSPENRFEASPLRGNSTATGTFRRHLGLHAPFHVTTHRGHSLKTFSIPRIGAPEDLRPLGRGSPFWPMTISAVRYVAFETDRDGKRAFSIRAASPSFALLFPILLRRRLA